MSCEACLSHVGFDALEICFCVLNGKGGNGLKGRKRKRVEIKSYDGSRAVYKKEIEQGIDGFYIGLRCNSLVFLRSFYH